MANTRTTIIAALVSDLGGLSGVKLATNRLYTPSQARDHSPYIGVILISEERLREDTTHIRYGAEIDFVLIASDDTVSALVDKVKDYIYDVPSIGTLQIVITGHEEEANVTEDHHSSVRIHTHVTYVATKGAF